MRRFPGLTVTLVALLACAPEGTPQAPVPQEARDRLDSLHSTVRLPRVAGATAAVPDAMRVTVGASGIHVDVVDFLDSAPAPVVATFLEILETAHFPFDLLREAVDLDDFTLREPADEPPLEPLRWALAQFRLFAESDMEPPAGGFPLILHVDRRAPFELVAAVVDLVRQEMRRVGELDPFGGQWIAVQGDGEVRALPPAPAVDPISALDIATVACASPLIHFAEPGRAVFAIPRNASGARIVQPVYFDLPDPPPPEPGWADKLVVAADGPCPWVDADDTAELSRIVGELRAFAPGCTALTVSATPATAWGEVIETAGDLLEAGGLTTIDLDTRARRPENGCGAPLVLE